PGEGRDPYSGIYLRAIAASRCSSKQLLPGVMGPGFRRDDSERNLRAAVVGDRTAARLESGAWGPPLPVRRLRANCRRRLITSSTRPSASRIDPTSILNSASVAVFGKVMLLGAATTLACFSEARCVLALPASARRSVGCAGNWPCSPNTFAKSQPAGRLSGRSVSLSGTPAGLLGVLSTATRLVSRLTS